MASLEDLARVPWWAWAMGGAGALLLATPAGAATTGRAPRDRLNYATTLELYPGDPHNGAVLHRGRPSRTPRGPRYKVANLPPATTRCAWVAACRALLAPLGLSGEAATLFIAHLNRETGAGRFCWCNNFGNVKQFGGGPWFRLTDGEPYVVYMTASAGMAGVLGVVRAARYAGAYRKLLAGDATWYGDLGRAQYYGDASTPEGIEAAAQNGQREYDTTFLPQVRACATTAASSALWSPRRRV